MRSYVNYLTVFMMIAYIGFRAVVEYMYQTGREFMVTPLNEIAEIVLLFVASICVYFVIRRKMIGGIVYMIAYWSYFGVDTVSNIQNMINNGFDINIGAQLLFSIFGFLLPLLVLIDLLSDNVKSPKAGQTEWFYGNKEYDRKLDSRSDHNNYKLM